MITNPVNRGYAAAVNQALAVGDADFVLLVNPDVQYVSGSYTDVLDAFRHPRVGAVVTRLLNTGGSLQPNCFRAPRPFDLLSEGPCPRGALPELAAAAPVPDDGLGAERHSASGCRNGCMYFIRRAAIADVGLFDERFFVYYEETDWLIRAKQRGWRTLFLSTAEAVRASAGSSPGVRSRHALLLLESQHRYARKHFGAMTTALIRATMLGLRRHVSPATRSPGEPTREPRRLTTHARPPHDAHPPAHMTSWTSLHALARRVKGASGAGRERPTRLHLRTAVRRRSPNIRRRLAPLCVRYPSW